MESVTAAERFLQPVFKREEFVKAKRASVIDTLFEASNLELVAGQIKQDLVVGRALLLLEGIHQQLLDDIQAATQVLNTSSSRRTIEALLDLISLEGIYPHLARGVGSPIERRVRSVLQGGITVTDVQHDEDNTSGILDLLSEHLYKLVISKQGVSSVIQDRTLVDLIAAIAQLAYGSNSSSPNVWSSKLSQLIERLNASVLFPSLISLLHSTTPEWLRPHVTVPLSLLPMRSNGVRQTITFVAKTTPQRQAQNQDEAKKAGQGPVLSLEVLAQISKVLSAVPSTVSPETYFNAIGPQLIDLLADKDPDASRAATYTISHGILSKRQFGQPGSAGWNCFAEPLLRTISPSLSSDSSPTRSRDDIHQALKVLKHLNLTFIIPSLSKRLLSPIILALWAIGCVSKPGSSERDIAFELIEHYLNTVAGSAGLISIANGLIYDGDDDWKYFNTSIGNQYGIEVTTRDNDSAKFSTLEGFHQIQSRVDLFMQLVEVIRDDEAIRSFFVEVLRISLARSNIVRGDEESENLRATIYASIAQRLVSLKSQKIMSSIPSIVSVMEEVLSSQIGALNASRTAHDGPVSRLALASITKSRQEIEDQSLTQDIEDTLDTCLPWLILTMQSNSIGLTKQTFEYLQLLKGTLSKVLYISSISKASKETIRLVLRLVDEEMGSLDNSNSIQKDHYAEDFELYEIARKNMEAVEAPVRVQGLSQMEILISRGSPVITITSTALTAIAMLQDSDSFVYLSAIKMLVSLARKDSKSTLKTIQDAYQDVTEQSTVDVRLRMGEALQTILEETGQQLSSNALNDLAKMLIFISSRRVYRIKAHEAQKRAEAVPRSTKTNEENLDAESDEDATNPQHDLQAIMKSWKGRAGEEDLRIRASALTILGAAYEFGNFAGISSLIEPSLEISSSILEKERGQENAILRRTAVLLVLSIVKGQDKVQDGPTDLTVTGYTDGLASIDSISHLLSTVAVEDDDDIVRGHAENVLEAIRDWKQETFDKLIRGDDIRFGFQDEQGNIRLNGLQVNPDQSRRPNQSRIQELD